MDWRNIIKLEPIDLTHIILYLITIAIIYFFFNQQLKDFFAGLKSRPITVTMTGGKAEIHLDAPVEPKQLTKSISNPTADEHAPESWNSALRDIHSVNMFEKMGFPQLHESLKQTSDSEIAVLDFVVNDPNKAYFKDQNMLKYLSIASQKIKYLAFYENNQFVAYIKISRVVKGLASGDPVFANFADKLKNEKWKFFPGLIPANEAFTKTPTIKELYERLVSKKITEVPLLENGKLKAILNYETVADALYSQTSKDT